MSLRHYIVLFVLCGGALLGILVGFVVLLPYVDPELPAPDASRPDWTIYTDHIIGFAVDVPPGVVVESFEDGALFRLDGAALVHIGWMEEEAARKRGLWPGHEPVEDIVLARRPGKKYVYTHYDALSGVRTHAWVVPHRGRRLALEIRTRRASILEEFGLKARQEPEPSEAGRRVVDSLRFSKDPTDD